MAGYSRGCSRRSAFAGFVDDACYGDLNSAIIRTCRQASDSDRYQHGVLNRYHLAYNYRLSTSVLPKYQQYLPHHFLTTGRAGVTHLTDYRAQDSDR